MCVLATNNKLSNGRWSLASRNFGWWRHCLWTWATRFVWQYYEVNTWYGRIPTFHILAQQVHVENDDYGSSLLLLYLFFDATCIARRAVSAEFEWTCALRPPREVRAFDVSPAGARHLFPRVTVRFHVVCSMTLWTLGAERELASVVMRAAGDEDALSRWRVRDGGQGINVNDVFSSSAEPWRLINVKFRQWFIL